jgi:hypothetical protein
MFGCDHFASLYQHILASAERDSLRNIPPVSTRLNLILYFLIKRFFDLREDCKGKTERKEAGECLLQPKKCVCMLKGTYFFFAVFFVAFFTVFFTAFFFAGAFFTGITFTSFLLSFSLHHQK